MEDSNYFHLLFIISSPRFESNEVSDLNERRPVERAWWKTENSAKMLALRVARANDDWEKYWAEAA